MTTAVLIAGAVVAYFAVVVVILRRIAARGEARLREVTRGRPSSRVETVRSLGLRSRGKGQVRGTGRLALVDDELVFVQWVPRRETRIPLTAITAIDTPRAFLGKTVGRRLLAVTWRTPEGTEDQLALEVRDLDAWRAVLPDPRGQGARGEDRREQR